MECIVIKEDGEVLETKKPSIIIDGLEISRLLYV